MNLPIPIARTNPKVTITQKLGEKGKFLPSNEDLRKYTYNIRRPSDGCCCTFTVYRCQAVKRQICETVKNEKDMDFI